MHQQAGGNDQENENEHDINRRSVLVGGTTLVVSAGLMSGEADASTEAPENLFTQAGDRIQYVKGKMKGELARPEHLVVGERQIEAFPFDTTNKVLRRKNRLNRMLLVRLDTDEMDDVTKARSADGVLAFSAVCTHRGCTIKSWVPDKRHLRCHCHLTSFAALTNGDVQSGPARRSLPMVPLQVDEEGYLVATDGFTTKPGAAKK